MSLFVVLVPIYYSDTNTFLTSKFASLWVCRENVEPAAKKNDLYIFHLKHIYHHCLPNLELNKSHVIVSVNLTGFHYQLRIQAAKITR